MGLIVVSGAIGARHDLSGTSWEAMFAVVANLLVFFSAHAYAANLAGMSHHCLSFSAALRVRKAESHGMLVVGLVPQLVLLLGAIGVPRPADAVWLALLIDVLLLGLLGWAVTAARIRSAWVRLGRALVAAGFGCLIIVPKALIH